MSVSGFAWLRFRAKNSVVPIAARMQTQARAMPTINPAFGFAGGFCLISLVEEIWFSVLVDGKTKVAVFEVASVVPIDDVSSVSFIPVGINEFDVDGAFCVDVVIAVDENREVVDNDDGDDDENGIELVVVVGSAKLWLVEEEDGEEGGDRQFGHVVFAPQQSAGQVVKQFVSGRPE